MGVTPQQTDDPPPSVVEATPTLIDKFRGRNTLIKVARTATARREAKRQAAEDHRKSVARRIALYLRRGVCDHCSSVVCRLTFAPCSMSICAHAMPSGLF